MSSHDDLMEQISVANGHIKLAEALKRLRNNRDFNDVIYHILHTRSTSLHNEMCEHDVESAEYRGVVRKLDAISHLNAELNAISDRAVTAHEEVREARRYLGETTED